MFSLTPALSRWEREKHAPRFGMATAEFGSMTDKFYDPIQQLFPLPAGEGQGEGECPPAKIATDFLKNAIDPRL